MRITARQMTNTYIYNANKNQSLLSKQFEKLETGRGFTRISENVSSGKKALKLRTAMYRNEQYQKNITTASDQITAAESSLNAINEQVQTVKSLAEKALNGTNQDETSRKIFSSTIEETKGTILNGLNTRYLDKYILGGTNGNAPFEINDDGKLLYNGSLASGITSQNNSYVDENGDPVEMSKESYIDIGLGLKLGADGEGFDEKSVYKVSFSGLKWTGFGSSELTYNDDEGNEVKENVSNNVVDILTEMQGALNDSNFEKLGALYDHFKTQYDNLLTGIADLGTRSSYLESLQTRLGDENASLQESQKNVEGINDAEEISHMQEYNYSWLLTLKFGSQVLPQSLMDYIS